MIGGFMINYGVVGVGYFGAELARFMNMHDNAKITCVYDPENGENIARELQCINMSSLDALVSIMKIVWIWSKRVKKLV
uniref:Gfo/Idh/MocA-like oxidoreductase N-terminal domain-containing protein n=1 Tax=Panagrolaimus superbus TaxID=310955 RepID=A0A914YID9_9BILA